jgi:4-diphosphocytidyl-2C-methyl-D-erythritol kinase
MEVCEFLVILKEVSKRNWNEKVREERLEKYSLSIGKDIQVFVIESDKKIFHGQGLFVSNSIQV